MDVDFRIHKQARPVALHDFDQTQCIVPFPIGWVYLSSSCCLAAGCPSWRAFLGLWAIGEIPGILAEASIVYGRGWKLACDTEWLQFDLFGLSSLLHRFPFFLVDESSFTNPALTKASLATVLIILNRLGPS